ncbi:MAG: hypothetical protein JRD93_12095 [Deltaproteobacteria bacterium]|nr:hypothetical protein [Deltaproteobacteria bacterium]
MKRALLIIIPILLVITYLVYNAVNNHLAYKAKTEAEKAQKERIEKDVGAALAQLIKRYGAFDWVKEIEGRKEFGIQILTVELEQLWLTDRPTLFIGTIKDISTFNQQYYMIKIKIVGHVIRGNYELALKCSKQKVNSLLKEHPDLTEGMVSGVAVVANIDKIKTVIVPGYDGGKEDLRIGEGKSIDMVYIEDIGALLLSM